MSAAEDHDPSTFKQALGDSIGKRSVFADKIYSHAAYFNARRIKAQNIRMLTPVKGLRGTSTMQITLTRIMTTCSLPLSPASDNLVEFFFNRLIEKQTFKERVKSYLRPDF